MSTDSRNYNKRAHYSSYDAHTPNVNDSKVTFSQTVDARKHDASPGILKRSLTRNDSRERMGTIKENLTAVDDDSNYNSRSFYETLGQSKSKDVLEESVRDPNRPAKVVPGLTDFLQAQYR